MKIPVLVVAGATASGKTALSIELAKKYGGEIVNADSMQIYKGMDIGTAKPSEEEREGIVHHLMDFKEPDVSYSVAEYVADAHECIVDIVARGKIPIVTGGTGLYISSLVNDVEFSENAEDKTIRGELERFYKENGAEELYKILLKIDPESAEKIPKENVRRVIRAVEYYKTNGITISEHDRISKQKESRYAPLMFMISRSREELYERIERRVDIMMDAGLLEEAERFYKRGFTKKMQSMQGIGYKQLLDYFRGFSTLDEAVRIIKRDSRRYAKRQLTWFKRDTRIIPLDAKYGVLENASEYTEKFFAENAEIFGNI